MRLIGVAIVLTVFAITLAEAQPTRPAGACEPVEPVIIKVVPLAYARARDLADTLALVAPPRVRIVPYYPTNSLVISGPPAAVEQLIDIIKPAPRD
jgi:hypothetical protein